MAAISPSTWPSTRSVRLLKILLITLPIVLLCVPILRVVVANVDIVYPTPVTQSAFLKNYSPANTKPRDTDSIVLPARPAAISAGVGVDSIAELLE